MTGGWLAACGVCGGLLGFVGHDLAHRVVAKPVSAWWSGIPFSLGLTAVVMVALGWRFGLQWELLPYGVLAMLAVPLTVADLAERRLPSRVVLPLYPVLAGLFAVMATLRHDPGDFGRAILGMVVLAGFHLALALLVPAGMGAGDVKLAGVVGLAAGWHGWASVIGTLVWSALAGVLASCVSRLRKRTVDSIPYGPCLLAGLFIAVVFDAC
ncbi:prepilin peptidase [Amycolatopsis rhizosphaerae]|uniref:Prepilin peptidase n=1 Tax=Amycolatopsis rhizosphaerae TaxID=2053003 RepID=A0A558CTC0_9PSEU|nr:A24 family peptidase [Amycolatopsis rhizosphaerae]TVT52018.1 prepilin peptidase [Amycolatopsis rhizosphaerae]